MGNNKIKLQSGNMYHIYNRGINSCPIFTEATNYEHFQTLYEKHISPVADTFAWVLMGNHFHFAVRIKKLDKFANEDDEKTQKYINQRFSNLFNAYSKAFNKRYERSGSLFEHSFERKLIPDLDYLKKTILYIHDNPVHHGFCSHPLEYPWSSYLSYISLDNNKLQRLADSVFIDGHSNYRKWINDITAVEEIESWLKTPTS